jgi:hypothetical protein
MTAAPRLAVVVCAPDTYLLRRILRCPTCRTKRRFVGKDAPWYGPRWTCCGCGDSFGDGERLQRPARRGWRKQAVAEAKRLWGEAGPFDRAAHRAWLEAQMSDPARGDAA